MASYKSSNKCILLLSFLRYFKILELEAEADFPEELLKFEEVIVIIRNLSIFVFLLVLYNSNAYLCE